MFTENTARGGFRDPLKIRALRHLLTAPADLNIIITQRAHISCTYGCIDADGYYGEREKTHIDLYVYNNNNNSERRVLEYAVKQTAGRERATTRPT